MILMRTCTHSLITKKKASYFKQPALLLSLLSLPRTTPPAPPLPAGAIVNFSTTAPPPPPSSDSSSELSGGGKSSRYRLTLPQSAPSQNTLLPPLPNSPQHHFLHPQACLRSAAAYSRRRASLPFQSIGVLYMTGPLYVSDIGVAGTDFSAAAEVETGVLGGPPGRKRTGHSESLLCENSERNGRKAPWQRSLGYFCCRLVAMSARDVLVCARGGERSVDSVLVRESLLVVVVVVGATAVEELEDVQFEVVVDWREGWRGRCTRGEEDCVDFGWDRWEDAAAVEPEDVDSRRARGEGGRIGDTRMPESAFDPGLKSQSPSQSPSPSLSPSRYRSRSRSRSRSSSSSSESTTSTALQKVARLEVLPPAVLGVGAGVDEVASCERRCGRYSAAFSS